MVSLEGVVRVRETTAPQVISHFNLFRSAEITGNPMPGQSSGQALQAMEELAGSLPAGFDFAWAGQSLEEMKSGSQAGYIFGLSVVLVYRVLAAQYDSFVLPFIILLGVPLAVFGALSAQLIRGFSNDVFCQVGLVLLVGLAAKNSILIVEFAEQLRERGFSIVDAAVESARIRLRPILMTSFAFILGVLPLALASGAGAAASAYLAVLAQKRQVDVSLTAIETGRAQLGYNTKRREGGVGSRLNELRSAQILASDEALLEVFRLRVLRAQEALGVLLAANGPVDVSGEPAFEVPASAPESQWMAARTDVQLFTAEREASHRIVGDSSKDWWPTANVSFVPQALTPAGMFQASKTWSLSFQVSQPIWDFGARQSLRLRREADLQSSTIALQRVQIQARSEERLARAAIEAQERALARAREAARNAGEVLKITIVAFDAGASTNIEVIDAQRSARDLDTVVVQVEDALRQARLELLVALGLFPR